ncbi:MAG: M23 family metallopeptidase, partial [Dehalococcoidia bacterium]
MNREFLGPAVFDGSRLVGLPLSGPLTASFRSTSIPQHAGGHTGVDIGAVTGTLVRAPGAGRVTAATASSGPFGTYVTLAHPGGYHTLYAHLSRLLVREGQAVYPGDTIGAVGVTGLTTGPHLHWGLALDGTPLQRGPHLLDPLAHISAAPSRVDR